MKRKEDKINGCLLQALQRQTITFPQKAVILCGLCPNRSDTIGDLAPTCVNTKK